MDLLVPDPNQSASPEGFVVSVLSLFLTSDDCIERFTVWRDGQNLAMLHLGPLLPFCSVQRRLLSISCCREPRALSLGSRAISANGVDAIPTATTTAKRCPTPTDPNETFIAHPPQALSPPPPKAPSSSLRSVTCSVASIATGETSSPITGQGNTPDTAGPAGKAGTGRRESGSIRRECILCGR